MTSFALVHCLSFHDQSGVQVASCRPPSVKQMHRGKSRPAVFASRAMCRAAPPPPSDDIPCTVNQAASLHRPAIFPRAWPANIIGRIHGPLRGATIDADRKSLDVDDIESFRFCEKAAFDRLITLLLILLNRCAGKPADRRGTLSVNSLGMSAVKGCLDGCAC